MSPAVRRKHIDWLWMHWEVGLGETDSWPPQEWTLAGGN